MTGFSKRKKAKQTIRRNKAIEREKTALNQMRKQVSFAPVRSGRKGPQRDSERRTFVTHRVLEEKRLLFSDRPAADTTCA